MAASDNRPRSPDKIRSARERRSLIRQVHVQCASIQLSDGHPCEREGGTRLTHKNKADVL